MPEARELAKLLVKKPPLAPAYVKYAINQGTEVDLDTCLKLEETYFGLTFATADHIEGIDAFLEKREPRFKGR
ncbi:hypothetical protein H2C83_14505 [Thermoactinomyces sp. AMNI-1]|uniref:Enoyl-CoA hydratase n=1 Tax=Thermoactinomyces mirandus TaxID=2756294 RepID=A0A7W1XUF2_9BACL|nr:hypothetical protein [Thermoactinomyces mirandus]